MKTETTKKRKRRKADPFRLFSFFIRFIKSFRIKRFNADVDTGDFPLNAQLIPVASALGNHNIHVNINFENQNSLDFNIYTQLYKILWQAFRIFIINKN